MTEHVSLNILRSEELTEEPWELITDKRMQVRRMETDGDNQQNRKEEPGSEKQEIIPNIKKLQTKRKYLNP